jgi:hypothetical protein
VAVLYDPARGRPQPTAVRSGAAGPGASVPAARYTGCSGARAGRRAVMGLCAMAFGCLGLVGARVESVQTPRRAARTGAVFGKLALRGGGGGGIDHLVPESFSEPAEGDVRYDMHRWSQVCAEIPMQVAVRHRRPASN